MNGYSCESDRTNRERSRLGAFTAWKQEAGSPFLVARLKQEPGQARAAWGASALPWFSLTDKSHRVIAEGFTLDDLDAKLGELK